MEILFLSVDEVLAIHRDQVVRYGGSNALHDEGLLDSALAMPQAGFGDEYLHGDLFEMAAAYLFHIVKNHAFVDGNKRAGAVIARVFLRLNGWDAPLSESEIYDLVIGVAQGRVDKTVIAEAFRAAAVRMP